MSLSLPEMRFEETGGCSDLDACAGGCSWVEPDLCSRCVSTDSRCGFCGAPDCTRMGGLVLCLPPMGNVEPENLVTL